MKISLIASSVRCWLWDEFFASLVNNSDYEVVFAGNLSTYHVRPYLVKYPMLKYIHTQDCICPTQCYEIARRFSQGELIMWVADDCEFSDKLLDNVYDFHKTLPPKSLISIKTVENSQNTDLDEHRFFGFNRESSLMAPLGVISNEYLNKLGGFDRRYSCGQYENDVAMRVYEDSGQVIKYEEGRVYIEHLKKHGKGTKFWKGYEGDRQILEDTWAIGPFIPPPAADLSYGAKITLNGLNPPTVEWPRWLDKRKVSMKSQTGFFPYTDKDLLTVSQCDRIWPPQEV
jgi:hypothetical protein